MKRAYGKVALSALLAVIASSGCGGGSLSRAGTNAAGATTPAVPSATPTIPEAVRKSNVTAAHKAVFGIVPLSQDMKQWIGHPSAGSVPGLIAAMRAFVRADVNAAARVTHGAWDRVFGSDVGPRHRHSGAFNEWVGNVRRNGWTVDETIAPLTRAYVAQAYDRIFRGRERFNDGVYQRILAAVRRQERGSSDNIWTTVATANTGGIWGSYRTGTASYVGVGIRGADPNAERCVGGVGSRCDGSPKSKGVRVGHFRRMDGVEMSYVRLETAVGSIIHDYSCRYYHERGVPWPTFCVGGEAGAFADAVSAGTHPGAREWNKAFWNMMDGHYWHHEFGPYPTDAGEHRYFTDDERNSSWVRHTRVRPTGSPWLTQLWSLGEFRAANLLKAPAGAKMDHIDPGFCASGRFREEQRPWGKTPFGICA